MLDVSRCKVPTMASLFALADQLAALKYNQLQLYTEHTFAYQSHAAVWRDASPLTPDEIRALDAYCHERYIELVPNQNSFGHMERWLRHPAYHHLAESPGGYQHPISGWKPFGSTLKPDSPSLDFVASLYDELLPNFRSRQLNVGGDEPWELGQGWSQPLVAARGKRAVYLEHLLGIHRHVAERGHTMQFWGDIVLEEPKLARQLPPDVTGLLWGYEAHHPFPEQCAAFAAASVPFYVVPGTSNWNSLGGRLYNALPNIRAACQSAASHRAAGLLLTEWGDNGHHQPSTLSIVPILFAASLSWNQRSEPAQDILAQAAALLPHPVSQNDFDAIWTLGHCSEAFSQPLHNATWPNKLLFAPPAQAAAIATSVPESEWQTCDQKLADGPPIANPALALSRDFIRFACEKSRAAIAGDPLPRIQKTDLLERFRSVWLSAARPGGLAESLETMNLPNS